MMAEDRELLRQLERATSRNCEPDVMATGSGDDEFTQLREGWLSFTQVLKASDLAHESVQPVVTASKLKTGNRAARFSWGWSSIAICVALLVTVWEVHKVWQDPAASTGGNSETLIIPSQESNTSEASDHSAMVMSDPELSWDDEVDDRLALVGAMVAADSDLMRNGDWSWLQLESEFQRMSYELHDDSL